MVEGASDKRATGFEVPMGGASTTAFGSGPPPRAGEDYWWPAASL